MSGRHGNKGIVSIIVPEEDMPHTSDGQCVDVSFKSFRCTFKNEFGTVIRNNVRLGWRR